MKISEKIKLPKTQKALNAVLTAEYEKGLYRGRQEVKREFEESLTKQEAIVRNEALKSIIQLSSNLGQMVMHIAHAMATQSGRSPY